MSRLKIIYIVSLVILGVLIASTVFRPMVEGKEYSEVQRAQLLEREDRRIIEFEIINREGEDKNYTINVQVDGKLYTEDVLIPNDSMFTYIHHIYSDRITDGEVSFAVYKEGEATPLEKATYYLK